MNIPEMTTKSVAKGTTRARTDNDRDEEPSPANHKNKKSRPNYETPPSYKAQSPSLIGSKSMILPASGVVVSTGLVKSASPDVGQTDIKSPAAGGEAPAKGDAKTQSKPKEEEANNALSISKCFQCNKVSDKSLLTGCADACGGDKGVLLCDDCLKDSSDPTCNNCKSFLCKNCDRTFKCAECSIQVCAGCVKKSCYHPFSFCEPCGKQFCHENYYNCCASHKLGRTQCTVCYDVWVDHCSDGECRDQGSQGFSYCRVCYACVCECCEGECHCL